MKHNGPFRLVAFIVLVLTVGLACMGGTEQPPQQPPTPTAFVAPPTPVPQQQDPTPTDPPVVVVDQPPSAEDFFTEEFEGGVDNWTYFVTKNDVNADENGIAPYAENGYFVFDLNKWLNVYALYDPYIYEDVRIDARVDNRGTNNNNINLVCRYSDEGWYEVAIANNGLYWIWAYDASISNYVKLADGGSNKIKAGKEVNDYTFICSGRNLTLGINGFETRKFTDNKFVFREGQIGVGLSSFNDLPVKVEFDSVQISQP